jgi:hypothetical protein
MPVIRSAGAGRISLYVREWLEDGVCAPGVSDRLRPIEQSEKGELKFIEFEMVARILCVFHRERPEQFNRFLVQFEHIILDEPP